MSCWKYVSEVNSLPVRHAEDFLRDQLEKISAGEGREDGIITGEITNTGKPESGGFRIEQNRVSVYGSDERGLMYALYELAERIEAEGEAVLLRETEETFSPDLSVRGIDKFVMNSDDVSWWQSESYWRGFLSQRVRERWNRLTLVVGFDTAYLSPPYAFFLDLPEFPEVHLSPEMHVDREAYRKALRQLGDLCHEYGLDFSFAIWQQIPWQTGQHQAVEGLSDEQTLNRYCQEGVYQLLLQVPQIDILHFRVNHESGVGTQVSAEQYWLDQIEAVGRAYRERGDFSLELRAKGLTDPMIEKAKELGIPLTVSTKYWCEHAGLPYHLTQLRAEEQRRMWNLNATRRYSYADLLRKPRTHEFVYRLWFDGSNDIFAWGSPDYVRRFADSMKVGPAAGFEVMPPLSMKGGHEFEKKSGWSLFRDERLKTESEEERYWLFYRLFGRIGYTQNEEKNVWTREARKRWGEDAESLLQALECAGYLLPMMVATHFPQHPQLRYWTELSTGAALFAENNRNPFFRQDGNTYGNTLPSEEGLFYSIKDYVKLSLNRREDGRMTPWQVCSWFEETLCKLKKVLTEAEPLKDPETAGILTDLRMLSFLTEYHLDKTHAALDLEYYDNLREGGYLRSAAAWMEKACTAWKMLSDLGEVYAEDLVFAAGENCPRRGSWRDYLEENEKDRECLKKLCEGIPEKEKEAEGPVTAPCGWKVYAPRHQEVGKASHVTLKTEQKFRFDPVVRVRHTNQLEGNFRSYPMMKIPGGWRGMVPPEEFSPEWDTLLYLQAVAEDGSGLCWPGILNENETLPYILVEVNSDGH